MTLAKMLMLMLSLVSALRASSAQQVMNAEQRIETTTPMVFSNHNVNLNNVGLDDEQHLEDLGPKLLGPNVCTKQEAYTVSVRVEEKQPYRQRTYTWCWAFPPRCSKYKIQIKTIYRTEMIPKWRPVQVCCKGYARSSNGTSCIPICSQHCYHGKCVEPDVCKCEPGYGGPACSKSCPPGKWGEDCGNDCPCLNGAQCNPLTGECTCTPGWHGQQCNIKCPYRTYGQDCKERCNCQNGGSCDHISGACTCTPGWRGALCDEPCPPGTHGSECKSSCQCQNGGSCHPVHGKCYCPRGWTGQVCANPCPPGTFGVDCKNRCDCYNGALCDHVSGQCHCLPGFQGEKCQAQCPYGKYGLQCKKSCNCKNGGTCNPVDGSCSCPDGWEGEDCAKRSCEDPTTYGPHCSLICSCDRNNTELCHPWTGGCICKPGYAGYHCHRPCPVYTYGRDCRNVCDCQNDAFCDSANGKCTCAPGFLGEKCDKKCSQDFYGKGCQYKCRCQNGAKCHASSGKCDCKPGWTGIYCDTPCPAGHYGQDCQEKCDCKNGASCNHISGECKCLAGYKGRHCEMPCDRGRYGIGCSYRCNCVHANSEGCDPISGKCVCKPGWKGVQCESICDVGRYGTNCQYQCDCGDNGSSCEPQSGRCVCQQGFTGPKCDRPCPKGFYGVGCKQACLPCTSGYGTCDYLNGQCECEPGFRGFFCSEPCPLGTFGRRCLGKCDCANNAECYHVNGECRCPGGWHGPKCDLPCPSGTFGPNCSHECYCHNQATCNPVDGRCKCKPGYTGTRCEEYCPEGYWGEDCYRACQCKNANFVCHPVQGCICRPGFAGQECNVSSALTPTVVDKRPQTRNGMTNEDNERTTLAGIITVAILGGIILCIIIYFKFYRKFKRMKTELAHVHYIADPHIQPDRHHFDNPVYSTSYTGANRGGPPPPPPSGLSSTHLPLNNGCSRVVNHFTPSCSSKKHVNIEREKLASNSGLGGCAGASATPNHYQDDLDTEEDEHESGAFGCTAGAFSYSTLSNRKNFEADAQNPNLYSSLENLKDNRKMGNIYDELSRRANGSSSISSATVPRTRAKHSDSSAEAATASSMASSHEGHSSYKAGSKEYSLEQIKMKYDKMDLARPADDLKPHYHSTSTLKSSKSHRGSKELLNISTTEDPEETLPVTSSSSLAYTRVGILTDPSARKAAGRLSHPEIPPIGDLSSEVLQSFRQQPRMMQLPPRVPVREPDSGISSARSTTTVPWSHNDLEQPPHLGNNNPPLPILELPRPNSSLEAEHQF